MSGNVSAFRGSEGFFSPNHRSSRQVDENKGLDGIINAVASRVKLGEMGRSHASYDISEYLVDGSSIERSSAPGPESEERKSNFHPSRTAQQSIRQSNVYRFDQEDLTTHVFGIIEPCELAQRCYYYRSRGEDTFPFSDDELMLPTNLVSALNQSLQNQNLDHLSDFLMQNDSDSLSDDEETKQPAESSSPPSPQYSLIDPLDVERMKVELESSFHGQPAESKGEGALTPRFSERDKYRTTILSFNEGELLRFSTSQNPNRVRSSSSYPISRQASSASVIHPVGSSRVTQRDGYLPKICEKEENQCCVIN